MRRFEGIGLAAAVLSAGLVAGVAAVAQEPAGAAGGAGADLRREVSDLRLKLLRAEALEAEVRREKGLLDDDPRRGDADPRPLSAGDDFWVGALPRGAYGEGSSRPPAALAAMAEEQGAIEEDQKEALTAWESAVAGDLEFLGKRAEAEAMLGGGPGDAGAWASPGVIGLGALVVVSGALLTAHEARDRLRWRLRALGSRPGTVAMVLAAAVAVASGASPGAVDEPAATTGREGDLKSMRADLLDRLGRKTRAVAEARGEFETKLAEVRHARAAHALGPRGPIQKDAAERAERVEAEVQQQFLKARVAARVTSLAVDEARRLRKKREADEIQLEGSVYGRRDAARTAGLARIAACGLFGLAVVVPLMRVRRRRQRGRDEQGRLCPRCLNKDTLDFDDSATEAVEGLRARFRLKVCNACEYEIRENYVDQDRLCFPTVGIRASGKTHWMIMLYDMIKNANVPVASAIRKIPSREDARFDDLVKRLLYEGGRLDPTVYGLPYPLTFHVHDADPLGANKTMVNLFDFSGEMRNFTIDQNAFRSRALLCEGFTLFLDPAQVSEGSAATIEDQIQTLAQFAEEMHAIRGLPAERPIDLPIAVCVSKMDLLVGKNPMGTQAVPLIDALRATMTEKVDLALIHRRSQLCARAMPMMFPGWNVERMLRENFGGRYMFFPMSAVGLEASELGIEDLSRRTIAPFGMIEPLLWLLHMHGYCVLH